jgi:hypothetical protein
VIISKIEVAKPSYYKSPHWFRENLINKINTELESGSFTTEGHNKNLGKIASLVYTLLPDIK